MNKEGEREGEKNANRLSGDLNDGMIFSEEKISRFFQHPLAHCQRVHRFLFLLLISYLIIIIIIILNNNNYNNNNNNNNNAKMRSMK